MLVKTLSKGALKFQSYLLQRNLNFKILEFKTSTHTAQQAAEVIGCDIAQIVKSLLFQRPTSNQPLLILVSGKNFVDEKAIENYAKEKVIKAHAEFTKNTTGFSIGG